MKNILTIVLTFATIVIGIDWTTYDKDRYLLTITYDDIPSDSLIVEKKDLKNKAKIIKAVEHILDQRNAY